MAEKKAAANLVTAPLKILQKTEVGVTRLGPSNASINSVRSIEKNKGALSLENGRGGIYTCVLMVIGGLSG